MILCRLPANNFFRKKLRYNEKIYATFFCSFSLCHLLGSKIKKRGPEAIK